jgi:hypothetical protein
MTSAHPRDGVGEERVGVGLGARDDVMYSIGEEDEEEYVVDGRDGGRVGGGGGGFGLMVWETL